MVAVASVLEGVEGRGQISVDVVVLIPDPTNPSSSFRHMLPFLAYFNPCDLQLGCPNDGEEHEQVMQQAPTVLPVAEDELAFLHHWTRLDQFVGIGYASVPVFSEDGGTLALLQCLLKGRTEGKVTTRLSTHTSGSESLETLSNTQLVSSLNRTTPMDPTIDEMYLCADLLADGSETD